jgi:hypothetical protein
MVLVLVFEQVQSPCSLVAGCHAARSGRQGGRGSHRGSSESSSGLKPLLSQYAFQLVCHRPPSSSTCPSNMCKKCSRSRCQSLPGRAKHSRMAVLVTGPQNMSFNASYKLHRKIAFLEGQVHAQSSSPSYLLLASLDAARYQAAQPTAFDEPLRAAQVSRGAVQRPACKLQLPAYQSCQR